MAGATDRSRQALLRVRQLCETELKGNYTLEVIDVYQQPHLAKGDQILAIPTVVRKLPKPVRTLIGTLSDTARVLVGLDLRSGSVTNEKVKMKNEK